MELIIGDNVKVIDKYDMNFKSKGKISKRLHEDDITLDDFEYKMVIVDFGKFREFNGKKIYIPQEVPYSMHQLEKIK